MSRPIVDTQEAVASIEPGQKALRPGGRRVGAIRGASAEMGPPLLWSWLLLSALWIIGVFFAESRDGKMGQELVEVFSTAFVPPLVPPVLFIAPAPEIARTAGRRRYGGKFVSLFLRPLYRLYETRLAAAVGTNPLPRHVGIILDGNRRHARKLGITSPRATYDIGAGKLDDVLDWCADIQIPAVTLWVLSLENLRRSSQEVSGILAAVEAKLTALARDARIHDRRIRVRAIGKLSLVPEAVRVAIRMAEAATAAYEGMILNIAVGYGGRQEITDAVTELLKDSLKAELSLSEAIAALTPEAIGRYLYTAALPDPDLIIRTSGEVRLSGFMLWQSAHSEFYFTDVHWPAFRKIDFLRAIRSYQSRHRRFGT